jgi:hypothetical protein
VFLNPNHGFPATSTKDIHKFQHIASTLIVLSIIPLPPHHPDGDRVLEVASRPPREAAVGCCQAWLVSRFHIIWGASRSFQDRRSAALNTYPPFKFISSEINMSINWAGLMNRWQVRTPE